MHIFGITNKTLRRLLYIFIILAFSSCVESSGSEVSGGNFTVHFDNPKDKKLAEEVVNHWKEEDLLTGKNQDVKLVRTKSGYELYLISVSRQSAEEMSFEEISALNTLQRGLNKKIFREKHVELVITDENFKPIFKPNL